MNRNSAIRHAQPKDLDRTAWGSQFRGLLSVILCGGVFLAAGHWRPADADVIRLKSGGQIRGQVEKRRPGDASAEVTITTLTGARVTVRRDDVEFVTPRSQNVEEYETSTREMPDTVDAHWELAEWCRKNHLKRQRKEQLEQIILLDPDHEAAHRGLGHTQHNGEWMTRHEMMTSRGYLRHRGKYITQQELDLIEKTDAQRRAEQVWLGKVRLWFGWATGRHEGRQAKGRQRLSEIRDPNAVVAFVKEMADHADADVRMFLVNVLSNIPGPQPVGPLVQRSLMDNAPLVRQKAIEVLDEQQQKAAVDLYLAALRHDLSAVVRRAAYALGQIGDRSVIPRLIDALVTEHRYRVTYKEATPSYGLGSDGSIGFAGSTSGLPAGVEALARTGQLPYGAVVIPPPGGTVTKTAIVKRREQNIEVLSALKKLTGQNFGFDQRTWHLWWAANENGSDWATTSP